MSEYVEFESGEIKITTKNGYPRGWDHQYNGVACSQTTVYNKLVTLGRSESKYFNPDWWYSLCHRKDKEGCKFVIEAEHMVGLDPSDWLISYEEEEKKIQASKHKLYHSQLAQLIEAELNTLNPAYRNFRILGDVTEAYLEVSFERMGKFEHGYVLWENCD